MDKCADSDDLLNTVLYETNLVKTLLDTFRENALFKLPSTSLTVTSGYMAFVRKMANKLV